MIEYIDREALLQDIEDSVCFTAKTGTISPEMRGANKVIDRINCAPAADVEPVRHGRWELYGNDDDISASYFCSLCGWNVDEDEYLDHFSHFRYCPNCGAKMDEVSE